LSNNPELRDWIQQKNPENQTDHWKLNPLLATYLLKKLKINGNCCRLNQSIKLINLGHKSIDVRGLYGSHLRAHTGQRKNKKNLLLL